MSGAAGEGRGQRTFPAKHGGERGVGAWRPRLEPVKEGHARDGRLYVLPLDVADCAAEVVFREAVVHALKRRANLGRAEQVPCR